MMSYQDCQPFYKYHEEELIALFVETLTGTTFEMTVSPYDTIISIKNKIQRVEGIPVSQQHLLYNLHELENSAALMDYSITNGSTIKLVLSMRGGPISTVRRILPLDDVTWKELVDFNRDELLDDLPPGCRMAVLVFREGDQLNMFRVLENIDGSYSPLSDSWSGSSMRNLFDEDDSDECSKQRIQENTVTMEKMNHLKNKLEQLALQRKSNKLEFARKDSDPGVSMASSCPLLPPSRTEIKCESAVGGGARTRGSGGGGSSSSKRKSFLQLPPLSHDEKELTLERDTQDRLRKTRTAEFSRVPVLPDISPPPPSIAVFDSEVESVAVPRPKTSPDRLTGHQICEILSEAGRHRILGATHHCSPSPLHRIPPVPNNDNNFETDWFNHRGRLNSNKSLDKPSTSANLYRSNNTMTDKRLDRSAIVSPFIFQGRNSSSVSSLFSSSKSNNTMTDKRLDRSAIVSPFFFQGSNSSGNSSVSSLFSSTKIGKLPVHASSGNVRRSAAVPRGSAGKVSLSPDIGTTASLQSPITRYKVESDIKPKLVSIPSGKKHLPSVTGDAIKLAATNSPVPHRTLPHGQPDQYPKKTLHSLTSNVVTDNVAVIADVNTSKSGCLPSDAVTPDSQATESVSKPSAVRKKKEHRSRCAKCKKRLTVTNTYTCRCSGLFCTNHRYSEAHECTYDYKTEGRRILEQNNPLISAPKLPKI